MTPGLLWASATALETEKGRMVVDWCHVEVPVRIPGVDGIIWEVIREGVLDFGALEAKCLEMMLAIRGMAFHSVCDILWDALAL